MTKTEAQIQAKIIRLTNSVLRRGAPKDTGNLAYNSIRISKTGRNSWVIYVDENIAPYMKYTNENWNNFRPPLQGKKNPNEKWWNKNADKFAQRLAKSLGGKIVDK